ncbi:TetR/AcrR family transcriptional regulator [Curtobacterium sp. MCBD17_013]|uniref:TetR/AcrR family transcriptional regulator n=1 Tax=Curtobacterium sp. MCBD17_013 TaxID=2175668 RepID=UPI000DA737D4|nr:TetR/AcrR family transcriptional regulator [Curtobacterium sp. MCBD17_013]PZF63292.1 TetR/AcrR family transcriptional regulator [Curtobacterium sp. MCBD17_013]
MTQPVRRAAAVSRRGSDTRRRAQRAALQLFTRQGYESTSLREIADELGINKASLYHHFASKEAILQSLFDERGTEAQELLVWLREQPRSPRLLEETVLRWVDTFTSDKLAAIRFMTANPLVIRGLADSSGRSIGAPLNAIVDELTALVPSGREQDGLLVRMAVLSINAAVQAAVHAEVTDADVIAAAQRAARALVREVGGTP